MKKDDLRFGQSFCFLRKWKPLQACVRAGKKKIKEEKKTNKKTVMLAFASLLSLSIFLYGFVIPVPAVSEHWKRWRDYIVVTVDQPSTVDPVFAYDTSSLELIFNVYETLIRFDRESVVDFEQCLALDWAIDFGGGTMTFTIRENVKVHNGETLIPEDVEYSFERLMVVDKGSAYLIYESLLACYEANMSDADWMNKIDASVESNATHVIFYFMGPEGEPNPFNPTIFLQIIAQPFCSILEKDWAVAHGCWDGQHTKESLERYHQPEISPLDSPDPVMMGTGPYKFDHWEKGVEWSIVKNDEYWQGWPAPGCYDFAETVTVKRIPDWGTRKAMFLEGDCDFCYVPKENYEEVLGQLGIRCIYPMDILSIGAMFFNFNVSTSSPHLGPGFDPANPYAFDEDRTPINFFYDVDVRKGFAYSFDYNRYLEEAFLGEATQPATCVVNGLPYCNPDQEKYYLDLAKAEGHFRAAWGGEIWENGFTVTFVYNTGNEMRMLACEMIKAAVESLNPKFYINIINVDWGPYIGQLVRSELPMFIIGWSADYPHPHNFVHPFMHSQGAFPELQGYNNPHVDELIDEGFREPDSDKRKEIYYELQSIYLEEAPSIPLHQPFGRHYERDWSQGWYYNPVYPGNYYYHLWKMQMARFVAQFMTPEGEPYPFDIIISDGTWRREFTDALSVDTEVPTSFTFTYTYHWPDHPSMMQQGEVLISPSETKEFVAYAVDPTQMVPCTTAFIPFEEVGGNASVSFEWDNISSTLTLSGYVEPGKIATVAVAIDNNILEAPNYVLSVCAAKQEPWICIFLGWRWRFSMSFANLSISFSEFGPNEVIVGCRRALYNDAIIDTTTNRFSSALWNLEGRKIDMEFVYPQYAIVPGNYILQPLDIPEGHTRLKLPLRASLGKPVVLDVYPPKISDLEPFDFSTAAEYFFAYSSYSGLIHNVENKTIRVNVSTETDYDWWGYFVLPTDRMVKTLTAYSDGTSHQLSKFYNYTSTLVDDYNIITVRIPPEIDGLNCTYTVFGDINGDEIVNILDISTAAKAFGTGPSHLRWDPICDINYDFKVNILDIAAIATQFGKTI